MTPRWQDIPESVRIARLTAGRRDPAELRAERLRDYETARQMIWVTRYPTFADLSGCCEVGEIQQ